VTQQIPDIPTTIQQTIRQTLQTLLDYTTATSLLASLVWSLGVRRDIIESNPFGYLAQTDPLFAHIYSNTMWNISNVSEGNMQIDALSGGDEMETGKNYYTKVRSLTSDEGGQLAFAIFMIMIRGGEEGKKSLEALKGKAYVAFVTPEDNIGT